MNQGKMLLQRSLADMQSGICKVQMVGDTPVGLDILHESHSGRLKTLVVRSNPDMLEAKLAGESLTYFDILPLSLEEIFIYELGGADYEIKNIIL